MINAEPDWKLKLRYGKLKTPYNHFTVLADGVVETENDDFDTAIGPAIMGLKVWSTDLKEAEEVVRAIGQHLGFNPSGEMQFYESDPQKPPGEKPSAYGANFTAYT